MDRLPRRPHRRPRARARALRDAQAPGAGAREAGGRPRPAQHRLHQHDPAGERALVPRRRAHRAADPGLHPVERRHHGVRREPQGARGRRSHRDLPVVGLAVRGRLQPLLQGQGPPRRRRPGLHPGPRLPRHLRPGVPRGSVVGGAAAAVPPGGPARRRAGVAVVPPPPAHEGLLGVPDGVDGAHRAALDLPGAVQPLPAEPRHQGHLPAARVGVPRRRRDGRARVARRHRSGRA